MARQASEATANTPARGDIIRSVASQLAGIEAKIKALREVKAEVKNTRIKGDLGMKIGDFNRAAKMYQLEGDDRAQALATTIEVWEALGVAKGEQLDLLRPPK